MATKTYQSVKHFGLRSSVLAVASALVLSGVSQVAYAAGLGRLTVFSALGQPLRAEIEVTATREELADMKARLASPETFKQAGLDYATTLLSVRFSLDKRPNGQAVIRLSSDRPINDPFLDMLLELNWSTGRLVREYTFLLDPPEYAAKTPASTAPAVVSAPVSRPAAGAPSAIDGEVRARAAAQLRAQPQAAPQKQAEPLSRAGEGREVKRGETLHRVASETKLEGVSLDQMLVGLFRANPGAFEGGNMNRLRAGSILSIPDKSAIESVSPGEARKIVVAQSSDWNAYRSKLAGVAAKSPARDDAARQESGGKITAKVDDKAEPTSPRDQLKVSKAESGGAAAKESGEDLIAKDKALKEANERMAALEKNVADLQKLLELKNQNLADLQKQASATPGGAAPAAKPEVAAAKPAETPKAAESVPAPTPAASQPSAPAPEAAPAKVEPPPPAPAAKPAEKPKVVAPPPPKEPGFFEELLGDTTALVGGGGILALIAGYLFMRRRRAMTEAPERDLSSTLTPPSTTGLTANSVFRNTGGQSVDTSSQVPAQTDFSQAGPGSIDTDEVDPVAEADVYMAYGRDAQAEEILLEARQKDPKRTAIVVKLLEIYSGRKDAKQFEALATELYGETGGVGSDWEKAAAMGRLLDPNNPIFRGTVSSTLAAAPKAGLANDASSGPAAPVVAAAAGTAAAAALASLDFDLGDAEGKAEPLPEPEPVSSNTASPLPETLDFDLGGDAGAAAASVVEPAEPAFGPQLGEVRLPEEPGPGASETTGVDVPDLDFDIGTKIAPLTETLDRQEAKAQLSDLDFDLGTDSVVPADYGNAAGQAEIPVPADGQALDDDAVEFDVSLTESTFLGRLPPEPSSFDMASIDLDLQSPDLDIAGPAEQPPAAEEHAFEGVQVSTAVNPDFASEQLETVVTPSGFAAAQGDTALNPDFALEQMETQVVPGGGVSQSDTALNFEFANQQAETIVSPSAAGSVQELTSELDIAPSEEVATKLDLAKAYEEMGDVEGARELLQEVLKEGDADQRQTAQEMLARVSG